MKYAIIRLMGRQYEVQEGEEILVDKMTDPKNATADVLLFSNEGKVSIGKPVLKDIKVTFKMVTEEEKGKKVDVYHFHSKSRYKKHTGFRPKYTRLSVTKIS